MPVETISNIPIFGFVYYFVTPIATAVGVFVASFSVYRNTESAKKRATIDMIVTERNDKPLQDAITKVNELAKDPGKIFATYLSEDAEDKITRQCIFKVLNQREFVSAGVMDGALHKGMYKNFSYSMFLRDWSNLKGFIYELRKTRNAPTAFQEFETLAKEWEKKPLKVKH